MDSFDSDDDIEPGCSDNDNDDPNGNISLDVRRPDDDILESIEYYLQQGRKKKAGDPGYISEQEQSKLNALCYFLRARRQGLRRGEASALVANMQGRSLHWSRCLVRWASEWRVNGRISLSTRGRHTKTVNLLTDGDVYRQLLEWLRANKFEASPASLMDHVNENLLPRLGKNRMICLKTAERWMKVLGWEFSNIKKGCYMDGHEREDVQEYRKVFLKKMEEYERCMIRIAEDGSGKLALPSDYRPKEGERPIVFYTHDESTFYANDGKSSTWRPTGEMPLRKKGQGLSLMVSEFISEVCGPLSYKDPATGVVESSVEFLNAGTRRDGWWTGDDMARQFRKAISIHKKKHPALFIGLWAFDNATNHSAFAKDALLVRKMNVGPGGKQPVMRSTTLEDGTVQEMVFPLDHHAVGLCGAPKGMAQVLKERGLWRDSLIGTCQVCKENRKTTNDSPNCCMTRILELQKDFASQKSVLEEIAEEEGQLIIFYPKFHCELNFIEMYWAAVKRFTRAYCNYTFKGLEKTIPLALKSVGVEKIQRFARKSFRYMDAYRKGMDGALADIQVRKYRSHRRIPSNWCDE